MNSLGRAKLGRHTTAATRHNWRLDTKMRDALELLSAASPRCPEPLLLALGFKIEVLADLVRQGLATALTEPSNAGGRPVEVVHLKITEAGRRALRRPLVTRPCSHCRISGERLLPVCLALSPPSKAILIATVEAADADKATEKAAAESKVIASKLIAVRRR